MKMLVKQHLPGQSLWLFAWFASCLIGIAFLPGVHVKKSSPNMCATELWQAKLQRHATLVSRRVAALSNVPPTNDEKTAYDAFEATYVCHSDSRRGRDFGDGGKFICGDERYFAHRRLRDNRRCLVYSVGSNGDAAFEQDLVVNFGCEVHTFDPTGNSTYFREVLETVGAQFHAIGIGGTASKMQNAVTGEMARVMLIKDVLDHLGHSGRHVDIFKIDCEGCEYAAFEALWPHMIAGNVSIGQIEVELHGTHVAPLAKFFDGAEKAGFMVFHKERNQWGCQGYTCVEYSLIHRTEAERIFRYALCPEQSRASERYMLF